ncbi:MAG: DNA translocase FtsK 4TM domain-containing protein [Pseudomonadota bacterium]
MLRALKESALWVFGALALLLLLALLSYDASDPGFTDTGGAGPVSNLIGSVGAWVSDLLYFLFGRPAYLFPVLLGYTGYLLFHESEEREAVSTATMALRLGGFILTLASSAGLATLHFNGLGLPQTAGGVLGDLVGGGFAAGVSFLGATLLLLALWLTGVAVFTGISWLKVMDLVGLATLNAGAWSQEKFWSLRELWQQRQEARKKARATPVIVQPEIMEPVTEIPVVSPRKKSSKLRIEPVLKGVEKSDRAERERQVPMFETGNAGELPPLNLLSEPPPKVTGYSEDALEAMSRQVELKLKDFNVDVDVVSVHPGPVVTRFELRPSPGTKVSKISALAKDLARSLSAISVRVVEVIPGKSVIGLELPNESRELVTLGEILHSKAYDQTNSPLALALGKDISGQPVVADLAKMPHLMIAGTTGSGKSVAINAMVLSLLYKSTAEHVRLIMIDPKMLELSVYEGIPHLLAPVVTDMKEAANALRWCVAEMERRYRLMSHMGVRNLAGYNKKIQDAIDAGQPIPDPLYTPPELLSDDDVLPDPPTLTPMPQIVVIVDELADMMMIVGKKVEELIARLAQKARASGIHLILATQRPSVDVITGLIKANIPARIAFQVSSRVDSRTILDQMGAEQLLGHGDMLYLPPGTSIPNRVHGAFVDDGEVHQVVGYLRGAGRPNYIEEILEGPQGDIPGLAPQGGDEADAEQDVLYDQAVRIVTETRKASISGVQRRLKIGYNRAARMVESMEAAGIVGPLQSNGSREVLAPPPPAD